MMPPTGGANGAPNSPPNNRSTNEHFDSSLGFLLEATGVGLWDWHLLSGKVIYSRQWEHMLGYDENELEPVIATWDSRVLPEDHAQASAIIDDYLAGRRDLYEAEFRMVKKDGSLIWAQDKGVITEWDEDGSPVRLVGIIQDVTRIKQNEQELKEKSDQLDFVARLAGLGSWEWFVDEDRIEYSDDYLCEMGYARSEITGSFDEWDSFIHPDDLQGTSDALAAYLNGETDIYRQEVRMRHKDGGYRWTLDTGRIVEWDKDNKPKRILGGHLNIDKMKLAERQLMAALEQNEEYSRRLEKEVDQSHQSNQAMFDANPHVNLIFDDQLKLFDCNPAAVSYFGFASKDDLLKNLMPLIEKSIPPVQPDGHASIPLAERMRYTIMNGENAFETVLLLNGVFTPMRLTMKRIPHKNGFAVAVYQVDLRAIHEAQAELLRQDKMLKAANDVAVKLMAANYEGALKETIDEALELLSESVDTHYAALWQNSANENTMTCRLVSQWSADGITPYPDEYLFTMPYAEYMSQWPDANASGAVINGPLCEMSEAMRGSMEFGKAKSSLLLPIFLHGEMWGSIRFDDWEKERVFTKGERDIVFSGALMFSSAILRQELMETLIASREVAINSTRAKSEFLARMSHEIRTPMNAIIGMTTIARRAHEYDKFQYCLNKIEDASQQLLSIINDVLDMSKIEANKFEISVSPFDFDKMMQKVFNVVQVKVDEKGQRFHFDIESAFMKTVVSDELRLTQVMINLLNNAVKFTPEFGQITLSVKQFPVSGDEFTLHVEVKDTGIGITEEQKGRLFNSFEQADGGITRRFGGTGLGLSICKRIVELMGGNITVESVPGEGSTFIFEVNMRWGEDLLPERERELKKDARVLVVDDAQDVLEYFSGVLNGYHVHCDTASSGLSAVALVEKSLIDGAPYDLVFLDWKMPGMDGAATAREIRRIMKDEIIVVMISVADWSDIEQEAGTIGITRFLPKPVLPSVIFNTIVELTDGALLAPVGEEDIHHNWTDKYLLVVEDIEINREIILTILEETGVQVDTATNGLEAFDRFRQNTDRYDLILMDVQMPELDGLGATRKIRRSGLKRAGNIPIIAMTANAFKEDVRDCIDAGMNDHIAKPIDVDDLMDKLKLYLDH